MAITVPRNLVQIIEDMPVETSVSADSGECTSFPASLWEALCRNKGQPGGIVVVINLSSMAAVQSLNIELAKLSDGGSFYEHKKQPRNIVWATSTSAR